MGVVGGGRVQIVMEFVRLVIDRGEDEPCDADDKRAGENSAERI